jgi:hypothetical protein
MITQFTIGFSRTVNLGNFESCRIESSVTVAVSEESADMPAHIAAAQVELRRLLEETYQAQFAQHKKRQIA